jgi:sucrose phosphorylase
MRNAVQLITYGDRLSGGNIAMLHDLLRGPLSDLFGGVHLLPFYEDIDGADAGFDPKDHTQVDVRLGQWSDVQALSESVPIMADLIAGHISRDSPQFQDYLALGEASPHAGLFLTVDSVFPGGATDREMHCITRPRPGAPFSEIEFHDGSSRLLWTTFTSSQIDVDVEGQLGKAYLSSILDRFRDSGISSIRLDAAGYAIKRPGTSCFMLPETIEFIQDMRRAANDRGMELLLEIHAHFETQIEIAKRVDYVYDFALPPLILHTLFQGDTRALKKWLSVAPRNCITVLDTHDGIGMVDVGPWGTRAELLDKSSLEMLISRIHQNSGGESELATGPSAKNVDVYQINCTFYDALGRDGVKYLIARAIQLFSPGIPQIYYVGLLAGENDMDLLSRTNVGRDINRHYFTSDEIDAAIEKPVVKALFRLIRLRNAHPGFAGDFRSPGDLDHEVTLSWRNGEEWIELKVDADAPSSSIEYSCNGQTESIDLISMLAI